jgi:ribonuclease D
VNYPKSISKEEINELDVFVYEGEIIEIVTREGVRRAAEFLKQQKVLGFDTETRPAFTRGESYTPAILQLATPEQAFVFRLKFFPFPEELADILSDENILKVGVGIKDDLLGLKKISDFTPGGFFDLATEVTKRGFQDKSLRALSAIFLGKRLLKGPKKTNWERKELSPSQITYAATDAAVGILIYQKLF